MTHDRITGKVRIMSDAQEEPKKEETIVEKNSVTIDDFQKIEIRLGTVVSAEVVEGADKLYILKVDLGEKSPRQILSGIREYVQIGELVGKQFPFVTNLAPRMLRGYESQGMILASDDGTGLALLSPTKIQKNGTRLK